MSYVKILTIFVILFAGACDDSKPKSQAKPSTSTYYNSYNPSTYVNTYYYTNNTYTNTYYNTYYYTGNTMSSGNSMMMMLLPGGMSLLGDMLGGRQPNIGKAIQMGAMGYMMGQMSNTSMMNPYGSTYGTTGYPSTTYPYGSTTNPYGSTVNPYGTSTVNPYGTTNVGGLSGYNSGLFGGL